MDEPKKRPVGRPRKNPGDPKSPPTPASFGQLINMEAGDNSKFLAHSLSIRQLPEIDINDPKQVKGRIDEYFILCANHDMKPTVTGFCNALNISRVTLMHWKNGNFREGTHQAVIVKAYAILEELWESYMQNGKINPVSGIFLGKNNFGYKDQQDYVVSPGAMQEATSPEVIEAKYDELPDE